MESRGEVSLHGAGLTMVPGEDRGSVRGPAESWAETGLPGQDLPGCGHHEENQHLLLSFLRGVEAPRSHQTIIPERGLHSISCLETLTSLKLLSPRLDNATTRAFSTVSFQPSSHHIPGKLMKSVESPETAHNEAFLHDRE